METRTEMTEREALAWLDQVRGQLYRSGRVPGRRRAWVAVVRAPTRGAGRSQLIVGLGASMLEATRAAESEWQRLWRRLGALH